MRIRTLNKKAKRSEMTSSLGSQTFKREGAGVTAPVLSDGLASYTPGVSRHTSGGTTFNGDDYQGTNSLQTSAAGAVAATKVYDGFGMLASSTGTPVGPFGYNGAAGYQEDADTGLMLLGHRYYDSSTGRFITRDPAKDGENWYDYVGNNPTNYSDPLGLEKLSDDQRKTVQHDIDNLRANGYTKQANDLKKKLDAGEITYGGKSPDKPGEKGKIINAETSRDGHITLYENFFYNQDYNTVIQASILLHEEQHVIQDHYSELHRSSLDWQYRGLWWVEDEAYSAEITYLFWALGAGIVPPNEVVEVLWFLQGQWSERNIQGQDHGPFPYELPF